jgi:hypothetical protein
MGVVIGSTPQAIVTLQRDDLDRLLRQLILHSFLMEMDRPTQTSPASTPTLRELKSRRCRSLRRAGSSSASSAGSSPPAGRVLADGAQADQAAQLGALRTDRESVK